MPFFEFKRLPPAQRRNALALRDLAHAAIPGGKRPLESLAFLLDIREQPRLRRRRNLLRICAAQQIEQRRKRVLPGDLQEFQMRQHPANQQFHDVRPPAFARRRRVVRR